MPIALEDKRYMAVIDKLCRKLRKDPDGDLSECLDELIQEIHFWEHSTARHMLTTFFLNLYQQDVVSLKRDFCRVITLGGRDADSSERAALLRCLHGALQFYYGEDYSAVMNMCDEVQEMYDLEEAESGGSQSA